MRQSKLLPLLQALLVLLLLIFWQGQHQRLQEVGLLEGERPLPGTDWVVWENRDGAVVAADVLPPATQNQRLGTDYVQPGDRLLAVDYRPVFKAEVIDRINLHAGPGLVMLYQLQRQQSEGIYKQSSLFVNNAYDTTGIHRANSATWTTGLIVHLLYAVLGAFFIALLIPFLGRKFMANLSLLALLLSVTLFGLIYVVRYGLVMADYGIEFAQLEASLGWLHYGILLGFGLSLSIMRIERWQLTEYILLGLQLVLLLFIGIVYYTSLQNGHFARYRALLLAVGWGYVFAVQAVYYLGEVFQERERLEQAALSGGVVVSLVLFFVMIVRLLSGDGTLGQGFSFRQSPVIAMVSAFSLTGPLIYTTGSVLRFGKVSLLLRRSGLVVVFVALLFGLYWLSDWILGDFARGSLLRTLLIGGVMLLALLVLRMLFLQGRFGFNRYLSLPNQRRAAKLGAFISRIPRYTSSEELMHDVKVELQTYFRVQQIVIWLPSTEDDETAAGTAASGLLFAEVDSLSRQLDGRNSYWSRPRELAGKSLPAKLENALTEAGWRLVFPLKYSTQTNGLVFFGRRSRGVFTLEDVEQIQRLLTQTQLTLEILRLLETEKVLVQRTMEANMAALRSQINPHFLFNTLNTISALVHDSPDLAESAVEKLAYIFRHTLKFSDENFVSLDTELKLVETYLEIEKIRFGDRLTLHYDYDDTCLKTPIPTLVLQTIVENCIKHGIAKIIDPGEIRIRVLYREPFCVVTVYDNGPGIDPKRVKKGTGLKNTIERLHDLYNHADPVKFENTGDGTRVTLKLSIPPTETH